MDKSLKEEVKQDAKAFAKWGASSVMDALFIAFWVLLQRVPAEIVRTFPPEGIDEIFLIGFQLLFGITTFIPILFHFVKNTIIMYYQAKKEVLQVRKAVLEDSR